MQQSLVIDTNRRIQNRQVYQIDNSNYNSKKIRKIILIKIGEEIITQI